MELTDSQTIKLIEENLNNKFRYYLDNMISEKRPFGKSGNPSIQNDIMEIIGIKKTWSVSSEDELDELKYNWMERCFQDINDWVKRYREGYEVKLVKKHIADHAKNVGVENE